MIEILNVQECVEKLRALGMKISTDTLRCGIEQEKFPFGTYITTKTGNPVYLVYGRLLDQWIAERAS